MKLEDIVRFSLGFMLKKPKTLLFFIPLLLINVVGWVVVYLFFGGVMSGPEEYAKLITPFITSGNLMALFSLPEIQPFILFSSILIILGWVLGSYAAICVYKAAELEHKKKKWDAREMLGKFVRILPRYLLLDIAVLIIIFIPSLLSIGLVVIWQLGLFNSLLLGIFGIVVGVLLVVTGSLLMVYLAIRLYVSPTILVIEGRGIVESLKKSWSMTKGSFWYVFGYNLLFLIIISLISSVLGFFSVVVGFLEESILQITVISNLIGYLINFYTIAAWAAFIYVLYLSLIEREKKESTSA